MTPLEMFAADYFVMNQLSPDRQKFVLRALGLLEAHAGRPLLELDELAINDFIASLLAKGLHLNTARWYLHGVRPFYRWAWRRRLFDVDTYMRIADLPDPRGSTRQGVPRPYKRPEIAEFWSGLDERWRRAAPSTLHRWHIGIARYRRVWQEAMFRQTQAVVSLALFQGLRRSEIYNVQLDDLHPDNDYIVVRGKTDVHTVEKIREVPQTDQGREMIGLWLEFRDWMKPDHDRPWLATHAAGMGAGYVGKAASDESFDKLPGYIGDKWEFHRFRHTCATEWRRGGMKLETLQLLLGHANLQQTLVYAKIANVDVLAEARRAERAFTAAVGRAA